MHVRGGDVEVLGGDVDGGVDECPVLIRGGDEELPGRHTGGRVRVMDYGAATGFGGVKG